MSSQAEAGALLDPGLHRVFRDELIWIHPGLVLGLRRASCADEPQPQDQVSDHGGSVQLLPNGTKLMGEAARIQADLDFVFYLGICWFRG